jgi:hypothetical protein
MVFCDTHTHTHTHTVQFLGEQGLWYFVLYIYVYIYEQGVVFCDMYVCTQRER